MMLPVTRSIPTKLADPSFRTDRDHATTHLRTAA
jgi:hypothetical protein